MLKVVVIGSGNVAQHLIKIFKNSGQINLVQAFSRKAETLLHLLEKEKITSSLADIKDADIYIIAISDDAITGVSEQLSFKNRLVVHTSGSVDMIQLDPKNRKGVFYPLQTFSKNKEVDFSTIPICLEAEYEKDYLLLENLANNISKTVISINSEQRKALHVSAVFVSNFVNHLYTIGDQICNEHKIPFNILQPLILESADKIVKLSPKAAQTGPAIRKDQKTIEKHLDFLSDENQKAIYTLLTNSIQQTNV